MRKLYVLFLTIFSFSSIYGQLVALTDPIPKYGCPNTTHDVTIGVTNTSGISIPPGISCTVDTRIYDNTNALLYSSSQMFSDGLSNSATRNVTLSNVPFVGAMVCSVAVDLIAGPPANTTYSVSGSYTVQSPPNLTITENPTGTIEVQTALDGYSVRYYLDANYASHTAESTATTYTPTSSGSYTVKAYDPLSTCISASASNALSFTISSTTAAAQKFNFSVYPNPMTSTIAISTALSNSLEYELADINGILQKSAAFNSSTQIDVSTLQTGIYLLSIKEKGSVISTYKLVK